MERRAPCPAFLFAVFSVEQAVFQGGWSRADCLPLRPAFISLLAVYEIVATGIATRAIQEVGS